MADMKIEEDISRRLQALGLIEGTRLKLLNREKNGSLIIYVTGNQAGPWENILPPESK